MNVFAMSATSFEIVISKPNILGNFGLALKVYLRKGLLEVELIMAEEV